MKEITAGESEWSFTISDWQLFSFCIGGAKGIFWVNTKTNEKREYLGDDVEPEDCPLIEPPK